MAVEQSSQTTLTLASAIDNFNVTTFFNKSQPTEDIFTSFVSSNLSTKMNNEDLNVQNNNVIASDTPMICHQNDDVIKQQNLVETEPKDSQNNILKSSQMELIKSDLLDNIAVNAVESINIKECYVNDIHMEETEIKEQFTEKEKELIKVIQCKDVQIKELESLLSQKEDEIANLKSHLDKFQSVFPFSRANSAMNRKVGRNIQRQRAQGISAEPQSQSSMHELLNVQFPKYDKNDW